MALIASGCAIHDLSLAIDDTDRGLFHGDIEADVVLLAHGGAPTLDRAPSCRGFRRATIVEE